MPDLVSVGTFGSRLEAEIARGMLETNGIRATISADDAGGIRPELTFTLGVRLLVMQEDAKDARELLEGPLEG